MMGNWVCLSKKQFFSAKNANFIRIMFDYDVIMMSQAPYGTYLAKVIDRDKFVAFGFIV